MDQPHAPALSPDSDVGAAFGLIARAALERIVALVPQVRETGDVEAVHQLRVTLRRLRTAIGLFRKIVSDDEMPVLRAELRVVARGLGTVRDIDVLMARVAAAGIEDVVAALALRRAAALDGLRALLGGVAFAALLQALDRWIDHGAWRGTAPHTRLSSFAARRLGKWARRVRRAPDDPDRLSPPALHLLRIRAKKLRYATEALDGAFLQGGRARARFVKALSRLQDSLGEIHDMDLAAATRASLFAGNDPLVTAGMTARLEDALAEDAAHCRHAQAKTARRAIRRLKALPPWWQEG